MALSPSLRSPSVTRCHLPTSSSSSVSPPGCSSRPLSADSLRLSAFIGFALGAAVQLLILFPRSIEAEGATTVPPYRGDSALTSLRHPISPSAGYQIVKMAPRSSHSPPVSAAGTDSTLHPDDSYLGPSASQRGEAFDKRSAHSEMDLMEMDALPRMPRTLEDQKGPHPMASSSLDLELALLRPRALADPLSPLPASDSTLPYTP